MAITYKGGNRLLGLSSDVKPTADGKHINGSTFIETDTGKEYILNYGAWTEKNKSSGGVAELLDDYSQIRPKRFWDWFSGSSLSDKWSWKAGSGGVVISQGIKDEVDGGYQLQMTNGHEGTYDFNNIRQYNHDGAIIIGVCKTFHSDGQFGIGFRGDRDAAFNRHYTRLFIKNGSNNIEGMTADGSGVAYHDTGVTSDTNWHTLKIELTAGATHFTIDGVLRDSSTGSENETDAKVQPQFYSSTAGSSQGGNIRYLEAYNT